MRTNDSIKCLFHFPLLFFVAEYPVPGTGYFVVFWTFYRLPDKLEFVELAAQPPLPLPMGEVPPKGAERALSVTA